MMVNWLRKITSIILLSGAASVGAQEKLETPSQKTREAVDKLLQAPGTIKKNLQDLTDTAKAKLRDAAAETKSTTANSEAPAPVEATPNQPSTQTSGRRDPFRPFTFNTRTPNRPREHLSPLERFDLGQLNLVGVIWDAKNPRALVEDSEGLGYVVKVGTLIGPNNGKVKSIRPQEMVIEETYVDLYGARKRRDVSKKLRVE
jgi:Tfp pilus assembly protein PilP